ncbi:MAG: TonB-dependent receptor [bacterium]
MLKKTVYLCVLISLLSSKSVFADDLKEVNLERGKIQEEKMLKEKQEPGKHIEFGYAKQDQVYSSSNLQEDIKNSSSSVDVITLDDIKTLKPVRIKEVLNLLPGFSSYDSGSIGGITAFRVRGWNKTLLTLDGMNINDQTSNQPFLNNILPEGIERIEVIKGPQGTVHGIGTQGGLVSMFTRKGFGAPSVEFESGMGTYSTFKENFVFQGGGESADYYLGITRLDTNGGAKTTPEGKSKNDGYENLTIASNLGKRLFKGNAEIRNTFRQTNAEKGIGTQWNGYPNFDPNGKSYSYDLFENLTFSHAPINCYDYNLKLGLFKTRYKNIDPQDSIDFVDSYNRTDNTRLMLSTQHNLKYKNLNTFTSGYNLEYNDFATLSSGWGTVSTQKDLTNNDVYFHDVINIKDTLFIRGGTRITTNSIWGTYTTPNISGALVFPTFNIPDSYTKFRTSYGYSINTPTPTQLYAVAWGGNPNLKPEKLEGWDVGMVQSFFKDKANAEFGYFRNDISNLITWVPDPANWWIGGTYQNVARAKTYGWESSLKLNPIPGLKTMINYTYTDAQQQNQELYYLPNNRWNFLVNYSPNYKYDVYWKGTTSSSRYTLNNTRIKGYFDMAVGATVMLFKVKDVQVYGCAQLNNLLNQRYEERLALPHPGIHFLAGIFVKRAF